MNFSDHCIQVSRLTQELVELEEDLEAKLLLLDEDRTSTIILTELVQGVLAANSLAETIRYGHIAPVAEEEPAVGEALELSLSEVLKRLWSIYDDLEVMTKLPHLRKPREARVIHFDSSIRFRKRSA